MEGWLACLTKLGILEDNPAWAKVAPVPELPEPPEPYLPMILLEFNEEEYMNLPTEYEDDAVVAPCNELGGGEKEGVKDID